MHINVFNYKVIFFCLGVLSAKVNMQRVDVKYFKGLVQETPQVGAFNIFYLNSLIMAMLA